MVNQKESKNRLKVFLPNVRLLTEEEIQNLSEEKRQAVKSSGEPGLWVEIVCPEDSCLTIGGKVSLVAEGYVPEETKGLWLNIFCPENRCEFDEPTDIP